jgi:uncharacterized protein DUF3379
MKCGDVHLQLGAEPTVSTPELEAHLRECAECLQYQREMLKLEEGIRRALEIDIPAAKPMAAPPALVAPTYSRGRQWALAASVLIAVAAVLFLWGALPSHSLAADVVSHVVSEPIDEPLGEPLDEAAVQEAMRRSGLHLSPITPSIVFMRTCFLRGRLVPHFIMRADHGTATVLVLPDEPVRKLEHFNGSGYRGVIIPDSKKGSIVVLTRSDVEMERYAAEIRDAVHPIEPRQPG